MKSFFNTVTFLCLVLVSIWLVISNIIFWGEIEQAISNCGVIVVCFIINLLTYFDCTKKFMFKELFTIYTEDDEELD